MLQDFYCKTIKYLYLLQCSNIVNFITVDTNVYNREQGRREKILYTLYLHFIYIPLKMRQKGSNFQYTLAHKQQVSLALVTF